MTADDLVVVGRWLREPHVVRWWLPGSTAEAELGEMGSKVSASENHPTRMLMVVEGGSAEPAGGRRIGWCQWYPYDAYPVEAGAVGAQPGDCGIDYAIGDPTAVGRGLGTQLIAALVKEVRRHYPDCGVIVDPDARNTASRRVLERNGFSLISVRPVSTEHNSNPMAIYRLGASVQ
jgi:aminoglycoside 6'-N-acetyltransferase